MTELVTLVLHYGGHWSDNNFTSYVEGDIAYREVDIDYISMFELFGYFTDLGYNDGCKMWYKISGLSPPEGIEEIVDDRICQDMLDFNKNEDHIDIYGVGIGPPLNAVGMENVECGLNQEDDEEFSDDVVILNEDLYDDVDDDMYVHFSRESENASDEADNSQADYENDDASDTDGSVEHKEDG